ncbi:MAG: type III secretion inner membrane ring lipoprotein SctJ [Victivallales bacterium]|nr:type III secretion inner membrane ring lipoprotein SctJ [Victivallales bacterium]
MKLLAKSLSILTFLLLLCGCDETVVLFNSLDEQQANPIMAALQDNHISCQKSAGEENTWKLMVKQSDFAKAVEICQQNGMPQQIYHGVGDVFKKTGMVSSPTEERIRFMDALAQDISRTISEIDGVISARVHIVLPNNDPFAKNVLPSSAAVAIRHRSDCDLEDHIPEIKNLVMNAIEGVDYDKITVTLFKVIVAPKDVIAEQPAHSQKISDDMMRILVTANASLAVLLAVVLVLVIMRLIFGKRQKETPKTAAK